MMWNYKGDPQYFQHTSSDSETENFVHIFGYEKVWAATAFKGHSAERSLEPDVSNRVNNHLLWNTRVK